MLQKIALCCYSLLWSLIIPLLPLNNRLKEGFRQRLFRDRQEAHNLWIQAASVGESFLSLELVKNLTPQIPLRVLLTTNTSQGLKVLENGIREIERETGRSWLSCAYFPFDKPGIMDKALEAIRPSMVVLLESELWPGLLDRCKKKGVKVMLVNGRMNASSLSKYMVWSSFWRRVGPDKILAMSEDDADRFAALFGREKVAKMHNIKFDRISPTAAGASGEHELTKFIAPGTTFIVLGSVRQQEENELIKLIRSILDQKPDAVIGVFPRHMHRVKHWHKVFADQGFSVQLRSTITDAVGEGLVIVWDTIGELVSAYALANAAFVGGSLVPLGGQNFLEPLTCGINPVIGPSWHNFAWIGQEIIDQGLVYQVKNWQEAADRLVNQATGELHRDVVRKSLEEYIRNRRGGTRSACQAIHDLMKQPPQPQ